jgi:hypothetical protein
MLERIDALTADIADLSTTIEDVISPYAVRVAQLDEVTFGTSDGRVIDATRLRAQICCLELDESREPGHRVQRPGL